MENKYIYIASYPPKNLFMVFQFATKVSISSEHVQKLEIERI